MTTNAETYLAQVRAALSDLPTAERDDLLEDLPGHLAETLAETGEPLEARLGTPAAYAAELRASAGFPAPGSGAAGAGRLSVAAGSVADAVAGRVVRLRATARELPYGQQVLAFLPELRPGWWVLRGYLLVAVPAALGVVLEIGFPPFVTLLGSDLLGLATTIAAILWSVRLGRRSAGLPVRRRQLVVTANLALVLVCAFAAVGLRAQIGYNTGQLVSSADTSYLQGPNGGLSNIYAFDSLGRPLRDVQLFDQDGRPIDTLLLQAPDGSYAEPVRALDENGAEVRNVFPRTLKAEAYGPNGSYVEVVPPPAIAPRRLVAPSPSPSLMASTAPSPSPMASTSPSPSARPTSGPTPGPTPTR